MEIKLTYLFISKGRSHLIDKGDGRYEDCVLR